MENCNLTLFIYSFICLFIYLFIFYYLFILLSLFVVVDTLKTSTLQWTIVSSLLVDRDKQIKILVYHYIFTSAL